MAPGTYDLTFVATGGPADSAVAQGRLELHRVAPERRSIPGHVVRFEAFGITDVDVSKVGVSDLAYSPQRSDSTQPGVQVIRDPRSHSLTIIIGNALSAAGSATDSGMLLTLLENTKQGFRGTWTDGGISTPTAHGYFCAVVHQS